MTIEFDQKGKIFTDIIRKAPTPVYIQLQEGHILGEIHVREGKRIKDVLDSPDLFLAVTSARIFDPGGEMVQRVHFLALNKNQVVWLVPDDENDSSAETNGGGA
jgi:hypothetical protein